MLGAFNPELGSAAVFRFRWYSAALGACTGDFYEPVWLRPRFPLLRHICRSYPLVVFFTFSLSAAYLQQLSVGCIFRIFPFCGIFFRSYPLCFVHCAGLYPASQLNMCPVSGASNAG